MSDKSYKLEIIVLGQDHASGPLKGISGALGNVGQIASGIIAADVFTNIAQKIWDLGSNAIAATGQMQAFQVGLESLVARELRVGDSTLDLNSALSKASPLADNLAKSLRNIAIVSPYELGTVQDTFKLGMAFGFTSKESMSFTRGILNMAAGVGANNEMMGRMSYNLAQIRMQGKVTAVDVRQLAMAGFDLNGALAGIGEQMGVTIKDYKDFNSAIASGQIKWEDFATAFEKYAEEQFGGAAQRMSTTLMGLKSTFSDFFLLTMPTILGPAVESITAFLNRILGKFIEIGDSGALEALGGKFGQFADRILAPLNKVMDFIDDGYSLGDALKKMLTIDGSGIFDSLFNNLQAGIGLGSLGAVGAGIIGALFSGASGQGIVKMFSTAFSSAIPGILGIFTKIGPKLGNGLINGLLTGLSLLPSKLGNFFLDAFVGVGKAGGLFAGMFGKIGGFVKFLLPLAPAIGSIVGALSVGIVALTAFGAAMKFVSGETDLFDTVNEKLQLGLANFGQFWTDNGPAIAQIGQQVFGGLVEAGSQLAESVLPWLGEQFTNFSQWFVDNGPLITEYIQTVADRFTNVILPAIVGFWEVARPILEGFFSFIGNIATALLEMETGDLSSAWEAIQLGFEGLWEGIKLGFMAFVEWVLSWFDTDWATVSAVWSSNWEMLRLIFSQWILNLITKFLEWKDKVVANFNTTKDTLVAGFEALKTNTAAKVTAMVASIAAKFMEMVAKARSIIGSMKQAGIDIIQGLKNGLQEKVNEVLSWIEGVAKEIAAKFQAAVGIHSPSTVFFNFGEMIMRGLANGIAQSNMAVNAISDQAQAVMSPFSKSTMSSSSSTVSYGGPISIYVSCDDPDAVADAIYRKLKAQGVPLS